MRSRVVNYTCAALGALALLVQVAGPTSTAAPPTEEDVAAAEEELEALRGDLGSAREQLERTALRLEDLRAAMGAAEADVQSAARRIIRREEELAKVAAELYKNGSSGGLEVLMSAEDFSDLEERAEYLESSGEVHLEMLEHLAADRALLLEKLNELDEARAEAADLLARLDDLESGLEAKVVDRAGEVERLRNELEAHQRRLAERRARALRRELVAMTQPPQPPTGSWSVDWDAIAQCESGGNWKLDAKYDGGLQFHPDTWLAYGGGAYARYAWQATREQQIAVAERVLAGQGPAAWPVCFKYG